MDAIAQPEAAGHVEPLRDYGGKDGFYCDGPPVRQRVRRPSRRIVGTRPPQQERHSLTEFVCVKSQIILERPFMTYVLLLRPRALPNQQALVRYFAGRAHYYVTGGQALYDNQSTEVYFSFGIEAREVKFRLDYVRCHVFALEAIAELEAFIKAFHCSVENPGDQPGKAAAFSRQRFLREWFKGNTEAYRSVGVLKAEGAHLFVDSKDIEALWRWNASRMALQERYTSRLEVAFVPVVRWGMNLQNCQPVRYAIWSSGVWIALPAFATHVILARKKQGLPDTLASIDDIAGWPGISAEEGPLGGVLRAPMGEDGRWAWEEQFRMAPSVPPTETIQKVEQDHVHDDAMTAARLKAGTRPAQA
jgi:hypothetical protein